MIKCGRKSDPSVATIVNKEAYEKPITQVVVTVSTLTAANAAKINSSKLYVATDADFTDIIETVSVDLHQGENTFEVAQPTANCFYKLEFDCQKSASNANGFVAISQVLYKRQ